MAETPNDLRAAIHTALTTAPSKICEGVEREDHANRPSVVHGTGGHHYLATCALCRSEPDTLTDAVMAVLDDQAVERMTDEMWQAARLRSMQIRNGTFDMDITDAREMAAMYVGMARTMLGDAENYSETRVDFTVKVAEEPESYVLTVQRTGPGKLTPHEARQRAETERDQARARIAELEAEHHEAMRSAVNAMHGATGRIAAAEAEAVELRLRIVNARVEIRAQALRHHAVVDAVLAAVETHLADPEYRPHPGLSPVVDAAGSDDAMHARTLGGMPDEVAAIRTPEAAHSPAAGPTGAPAGREAPQPSTTPQRAAGGLLSPLPHDDYATAVAQALTALGLPPDQWWTETPDGQQLDAVIILNADTLDREDWPDGAWLGWDQRQGWSIVEGASQRTLHPLDLGAYASPQAVATRAYTLLLSAGATPVDEDWDGAAALEDAIKEWESTP